MKLRISLLVAFLSSLCLFGALPGSQEILPMSSDAYTDMDLLYLVTGSGTPSNARPWTKNEAALILSRIDKTTLEGTAKEVYDAVAEAIEPGLRWRFSDGFQFGAGLDATAELYAHSNTADFVVDTDWVHGFEDRKPLALISFDFALDDMLYIYCDLQYGRNRVNYQDTVSYFPDEGVGAIIAEGTAPDAAERGYYVTHSAIYSRSFLTNILEHSYDFDFEWPKRAVAAVGGENWNLSLARDKISWGNGHSGNFIVDDHVDFQEYARVVAFSDYFKYDWLNVFFPTYSGNQEAVDTEFRVLMAHRLEFRILDRLTFAVSENVMYRNDVFDLRYINPAYIYHNLNNRSMFNAIAHVELDYALGQGLNVYAQYVMDQARAPNESAAQADAMGWLAGLEYARAAGPGILSTSLEYAMTNPLLYRRDGVDFLMFRKYFNHGSPGGYSYVAHLDYIGYQYGGDAQVLQWDVGYRIPGIATFGMTVVGMRHGEMDFFMSHNMGGDNDGNANYEGSTPSGDHITESLVVSLAGDIVLPPLVRGLDASARFMLDWVGKRTHVVSTDTYQNVRSDIQLTMGVTISL